MNDDERETVIRFDKSSGIATVFTYEVRMISRIKRDMERLVEEGGRLVDEGKYEGSPYATFEVPVRWVKVTPPKRVKRKTGPVRKEK